VQVIGLWIAERFFAALRMTSLVKYCSRFRGEWIKIGIVGGGLMWVSLGYYLARQGAMIEIFEADLAPGGLASQVTLEDGTKIDRYYHTILPS
jgi:predicted NAD/FAD-binding protein